MLHIHVRKVEVMSYTA